MFRMKDINALLLERMDLLIELEKYEHEFKLKAGEIFTNINRIDEKLISLTYQTQPMERDKRECMECTRTIHYDLKTGKLEVNYKEFITFH